MSGGGLSHDCFEVIAAMQRAGLSGFVTRNVSVVDGAVEAGCAAHVCGPGAEDGAKALWEVLRSECRLTCAHVTVKADTRQGCTYDVFRPSACPGAPSPKQ